jgi:hypothetical protein
LIGEGCLNKKLQRLEEEAASLSPGELKRLVRRLQETIIVYDAEEEENARPKAHQTVAVEQKEPGVTLKQEMVRCGKKNCHCATGRLHGPYWYKYWNENGRTRSKYIGKNLPTNGNGNGHGNGHPLHAPARPAHSAHQQK